jgi:hypothetical protein
MFHVLIFTRGHGAVGGKYITEKSKIDPGTVRLVAQRLSHYATSGPLTEEVFFLKITVAEIIKQK